MRDVGRFISDKIFENDAKKAEAIVEEAFDMLVDDGWLYFEIHEDYEVEMTECLKSRGFVNIELRKDLQGRSRMMRGQRVPSHHE